MYKMIVILNNLFNLLKNMRIVMYKMIVIQSFFILYIDR